MIMAATGSLEDRVEFIRGKLAAAMENLIALTGALDDVAELVEMLQEDIEDGRFDVEPAHQEYVVKPPLGDRITTVYNHEDAEVLRIMWSFDDFSNWAWNNQSRFALMEAQF
jgi:hypothetical protein